MSTGIIHLRIRDIYGRTVRYPGNRTAEIFCEIAKSKTMTDHALKLAQELGYEIKIDRIDL